MSFETYIKDRAEPGSGLYLAIKEAWDYQQAEIDRLNAELKTWHDFGRALHHQVGSFILPAIP